jgi:hypothetical protein
MRNACKRAKEKIHGGMKERYKLNKDQIKKNAYKWTTNHKDYIKRKKQDQYKGIEAFKGLSKNERYVGVALLEAFPGLFIKQQHCIRLTDEIRQKYDLTGKVIYVDYLVKDKNLMVEFDGPHHYGDAFYVRDKSFIERTKKRDAFLIDYCKENQIRLIKINGLLYDRPKKIKQYLLSIL